MEKFWETKSREEKTTWVFEPSDSAILTKDLFLKNQFKDILIPEISYGRNAKIFSDAGMEVTGIEISKSAIEMAKAENRLDFEIRHGSVTEMPFGNKTYDGIFCFALLHLLNKYERKSFIENCISQLKSNGMMVFTVVSTKASMYGAEKKRAKDRYKLMPGLNVFFYDQDSLKKEFSDFGVLDIREIDEPIKHMPNEPPLKCLIITCTKN